MIAKKEKEKNRMFLNRCWPIRISNLSSLAFLVLMMSIVALPGPAQTPQPQRPTTPDSAQGSAAPHQPAGPSVEPAVSQSGGMASASANRNAEVESENDRDLPTWLRGVVAFLKALSWPILLAVFIVLLMFSKTAPYRLARILKPFRSLRLFGTEFVLSEEVGADAEQAIEIYRRKVKRQFDLLVEINDVRTKLETIANRTVAMIEGERHKSPTKLRCTLHVPDILFADTLYQLVDYYPCGSGHGRTFSSRFGIIGLCWRSRQHQLRGTVLTDPQSLVSTWGMTQEQAVAAGQGRQSFAAFLLRDESESALAVLYMDSVEKNEFGADKVDEAFQQSLGKFVESESKSNGLISSLAKIRDSLKDRAPAIRIHEQ